MPVACAAHNMLCYYYYCCHVYLTTKVGSLLVAGNYTSDCISAVLQTWPFGFVHFPLSCSVVAVVNQASLACGVTGGNQT